MRFYRKLVSCITLWCAIVSIPVNAEPFVCYYCTTDADGTSCNSPLSGSRVQYCGNSTVTNDVGAAQGIAGNSTTQGTYVCTIVTYTSNLNNFVTIRECQNRLIQGVDICTYLSQSDITSDYSRSFSCRTCHSDLCNKATVHFSTAAFIGIALAKLFV